ncbi:MAG: peptide ABC transporter substrate-binding protein [Chlamydiales bacterium]|nr:peptide ABC transporter substrate-binding protein [Chlamydiales bacterium]
MLRLNLFCEPPTLDSRQATDSTSMNVLIALFEGMMRTNSNFQPELAGAKSYEISEDGKTYTFHLREHYWSNGDRVVAKDYLTAWSSTLDPKFPSPFAYKFYCIKNAAEIKEGRLPMKSLGVEAPNNETIIVHLIHPTPFFLELLATPTFFPVHTKTVRQNPNWAGEGGSHYICNGPFTLESWKHESEIVLKKNPYYWDAKKVRLDGVHLSMVPDISTEFYMFESGELDWAGAPLSTLPLEFIPALLAEGKLNTYETNGVYYFKLNTKRPPLNNVKIRRALGLAICRQSIVDHILQADQAVATSLVPNLPGVEKQNLFQDNSIEEAQRLFKEGLAEENLESIPSLTLSFNACSQHQKIAQAIQQQWKTVLGLHIDLDSCDWKVYLSKINSQNYDIGRLGWIGEHNDPITYLEPFRHKDNPHIGGNNETGWEDPLYAQLLNQADRELDLGKRLALLREAEAILIDQMPLIPIYFLNYGYLKNPRVHGINLSPLGTIDLKEAYLEL